MKITSQRSLLWSINFVIVFALIGCVLLMARRGGSFRRQDEAIYARQINDALKVSIQPEGASNAEQSSANFQTPRDANFFFEGYVKPPEKTKVETERPAEKAPDLKSLLAVQVVLSPESLSGPNADGYGFASIKILAPSKGGQKKPGAVTDRIFTYEVGDIIGIEQEYRDDADATLEKWGPCRLLAVKDSAIVCSWNKGLDEVEVKIELATPADAEVYITKDEETLLGGPAALKGREETKDGGHLSTTKLTLAPKKVGDTTVIQWSDEGIRALEEEGEQILDDIDVKKAAGGKGLAIVSLPKRLADFGLQDGDIIIELDGQEVESKAMATNYVRKTYRKKSHYSVVVLRDGKTRNLQIDVPRKLTDANKAARNLRFGK